MPTETLNRQEQEIGTEKEATASDLQQRANAIRSRARRFLTVLVNTKTSSEKELAGWKSYIAGMRMKEDGYDGIADREVTFNGKPGQEAVAAKMERSALTLYSRFHTDINKAAQNKWISSASLQKWIKRFENPSSSYKDREKWVTQEMPAMIERWKAAADERKTLIGNDSFKALAQKKPAFAAILSEDAFLALHYDKRRSLLASARASLLATDKGQEGIYDEAKSKLQGAVAAGIMNSGKVGMWLERIFKSGASPAKIEAFVNGSGATSLNALMRNWTAVAERFDGVEKKFKERWQGTGIRGFQPLSKTQFLSMHYEQRLQYINQAEDRLDAGNDVENEAPILLKIRHAMDTKDWDDAADLIGQAKTAHLSEKDFKRLKSMESYVKQFSGKQTIEIQTADEAEVKKHIDQLLGQIGENHSQVKPQVEDLLTDIHSSRNIGQYRWVVYNNVWCTTHGYLNQSIAQKGSSKHNEELTRLRSQNGEDTGRNDVIGATTQDQHAIRKREFANHKATFHHVDVSDPKNSLSTTEWLKKEQDPRDLYWRTYIANDRGIPKPENWHRELFVILTELRSETRKLKNAGKRYGGIGQELIKLS